MRKFVRASMLMLALSCFTYAGNMPINNTPPPPSDGIIHGDSTESTGGIIQTGTPFVMSDGWIGTGLTETALNALGTMLSLF